MKVKYIIQGEPFSVTKLVHRSRRVWDRHTNELFVRRQQLINQHGDQKKPYRGSVQLDITFYFMTPCNRPHLNGKKYMEGPSLNRLLAFVEQIGESILFSQEAFITSVCAHKLYDYEPRTEIVLIKGT